MRVELGNGGWAWLGAQVKSRLRDCQAGQGMLAYFFNPHAPEAEAGRSL